MSALTWFGEGFVDWRIVFRRALRMAREVDALDPENLAADMVEECLRSMLAGRIDAPTGPALRVAMRYCLSYYRWGNRRDVAEWTSANDRPADVDVERLVDGRLTLGRLQGLWPELNDNGRDAMTRYLLGDGYATHERKKAKNADNYRRKIVRKLAEVA